jgi:hypothetical protein
MAVAKIPRSKPAQADRHLVQNEVAKRFVRRFGQCWIRVRLIINPKQQANGRNVSTIGISANPDRINERRLRRISGAVNIRCTMSWSVPCVDMVMKVDPIRPAKIVYSTSNIPLILSQPCFAGSSPVVKKSEIPEAAVALHDFVPATRNLRVKQTDRDQRAANHDRGLDEIGPDHRFDAAESRVDGGQNDNGNR